MYDPASSYKHLKECSMDAKTSSLASFRLQRWFTVFLGIACVLLPQVANAQGVTGALIGTVKDQQGAVVSGAQHAFAAHR